MALLAPLVSLSWGSHTLDVFDHGAGLEVVSDGDLVEQLPDLAGDEWLWTRILVALEWSDCEPGLLGDALDALIPVPP